MRAHDASSYYQTRWQTEGRTNAWAMQRAGNILREISFLELETPRFLDYGCGTGWLTAVLDEFGESVGVDLAPDAARRRYPHITFLDANEPIPPGSFDVVVSQEVIEHVNDQRGYLENAANALRRGGYLIMTTPNDLVTRYHPGLKIQPVENHLTPRALKRLLRERFQILKFSCFLWGFARRPLNSYKLNYALDAIRVGTLFRQSTWAGLHLFAVARRAE